MTNRLRTPWVLAIALVAALLSAPAIGLAQTPQTAPRTPDQVLHDTWRAAVIQAPAKGKGCFRALYPSRVWKPVACVKPPKRPMAPASEPVRPRVIGNQQDWTAQSSGTITSAKGQFIESTATSVSSNGVANQFSLQLNSNTAAAAPACANPTTKTLIPGCTAWAQFVFGNYPSGGAVYIQYWLIGYGPNCPTGWTPYNSPPNSCYENGPTAASTPFMNISQLSDMAISGSAAAGGLDTEIFSTSTAAYQASAPDSTVGLSGFWNAAEFNVFGDSGADQAVFNSGTLIQTLITIYDGTSHRPRCALTGTTGETNNLNLLTPCCPDYNLSGNIVFQEASIAAPGLSCSTPQTDITSVTPNTGSTFGGNTLTILGNGFSTWGPNQTVLFNGKPAQSTYCPSDGQCSVVTPVGPAGTVILTIGDSPATNAGAFTFVSPAVSSISPTSGSSGGGTKVTLYGSGLSQAVPISFGGFYVSVDACVYANANVQNCTVDSPRGAGTVDVTTEGVAPTANDRFTYLTYPGGFLSPSTGLPAGGTKVTLHGHDLAPGGTTITLHFPNGDAPALDVECSDAATCAFTTPPLQPANTDPVVIPVTVTVGGRTASIGGFKYANPPPPPVPVSIQRQQCIDDGGHWVIVNGKGRCEGTLR